MLYNMRLLAFSSLVASVFATAKVTPSPTGAHPGIPGSAQLSDECTMQMVIAWYQPEMISCENIKVRQMDDCVMDEIGVQSEADLIQQENYRRCTAITITLYKVELWNCIAKGGRCDDATELEVGVYNSTDVKHARLAFQEVTDLKFWKENEEDVPHHVLMGCYTLDDIPIDHVTNQAVFKALKPPTQNGLAYIECGYTERSNFSVTALYMEMDKLYLPVTLPDKFFERLQMLPSLTTLDLSHLGMGLIENANETQPNGLIYSLNGTLEELILQKNNLETLADVGYGIANMKMLTKLDLHDNRIRVIPQEIRKLKSLEYLDLGHNVISELPDWDLPPPARRLADDDWDVDGGAKTKMFWPKLNNLETLIMNENNIKYLPTTMGSLRSLRVLDLSNNVIRHFPPEVADGLGNTLTELDLSYNELQDVPNELGKLKRLVRLNLANNYLRQLPPNMGSMDGLIWMNLNDNQLVELPDNMWKMESLSVVYANFNDIVYLSEHIGLCPSLAQLFLTNNKLKMLPEEIADVERLYMLNVMDNQIMSIPSLAHADRLEFLNIQGNKPLRCLPKLKEGAMWNGQLEKYLTDFPDPNEPGMTCKGHSSMPTPMPTTPTAQPICETPSPTPKSSAVAAGPSLLVLLLAGMMMLQ